MELGELAIILQPEDAAILNRRNLAGGGSGPNNEIAKFMFFSFQVLGSIMVKLSLTSPAA